MDPIDTETVDTPAGEYTIEWHYDESAEQPYNEGLGFAFDGGRDRVDVTAGEHADEVLAIIKGNLSGWRSNGNAVYRLSTTTIARYLRIKYGLIGIRVVDYDYYTSAPDLDRDRIWGIAWAEGDCFGYCVLDPSGNEIDSCWGYYGYSEQRDYTREQALSSIQSDAAARGKKCALAGAGFVGLI